MRHHFTTEEISEPFKAQFRNAPRFWREFVACYLFAQGIAPGDGPIGIKVLDYDTNGQETYRPARWFSARLRDRIIEALHSADASLAGWPMADDPQVWEVLGYSAARAGIGIADLTFCECTSTEGGRISAESARDIVRSAIDLVRCIPESVTCYRGVIS